MDPWHLSAVGFVEVIALTMALGYLETRRHRERALLDNLGVSPLYLPDHDLLSTAFTVRQQLEMIRTACSPTSRIEAWRRSTPKA